MAEYALRDVDSLAAGKTGELWCHMQIRMDTLSISTPAAKVWPSFGQMLQATNFNPM